MVDTFGFGALPGRVTERSAALFALGRRTGRRGRGSFAALELAAVQKTREAYKNVPNLHVTGIKVFADGVVEEMGGPPTPAVGWAAGVERLAMLLDTLPPAPATVAVVPIGDNAEAAALTVLQDLRHAGIRAEMAYRGNLRRRMERANRIGARAAVILGDDDIARGVAQVKNLATGEQEAVPLAELAARLR